MQHVDPVDAVSDLVRTALAAALGTEHAATDPQVRRSERADLQADVAMRLARVAKQAPRAIADAIVAALPPNEVIERIEVAHPGFLNIWLRDAWLASAVTAAAASDRLGVPHAIECERIVVDYSAPNVAKEMHVGHLRSTVIGDALVRVLAWRGHTVIRQNHIGDWGTPFGMLIEHMLDVGETDGGIGELASFYRAASAKFTSDPMFAERARLRVVALQAGDAPTLAQWRRLVALSTGYFEALYATLGVTLAHADLAGESFYNDRLAPIADELETTGYAHRVDGALRAFPAGFLDREGQPFGIVLRKSDGGFGYGTTDLAAIRYRITELGATRLLYVVGAPQAQHLAMIFKIAHELGWLAPPVRAEHVAFGSVLGEDGRMFRTRAGDTVRLADLIEEAIARAATVTREHSPTLDDATVANIAHIVGVGSIKYADLASLRLKDYTFDLARMVSFDGNSAGYCQYSCARASSVLRKSGGVPADAHVVLTEPAERALALQLLGFGGTVADVDRTLEPHRLVTYVYDVAKAFATFYRDCPVLQAEPPVRASRLVLTDLTARTLTRGLDLLGIAVPERM